MTDRTAYFKSYYQKHKEKKDAAHRKWINEHQEMVAVYNRNHREKMKKQKNDG